MLESDEIGCPELVGLEIDFDKAFAKGWEELSDFLVIQKTIDSIFIEVDFDESGRIVDVIGIRLLYSLYTCDCSLLPSPPSPYTCTNFSQSIINQIIDEIVFSEPPNSDYPHKYFIPLLVGGIAVVVIASFIIRKYRE